MTNGILPLNEKTLNLLKHKHPQSQAAYKETLINGETLAIQPILFDGINEKLVGTTAIRTKGGSGLTGLHADGRKKLLIQKVFGSCTFDLRKVIANFIKHICINETEFQSNARPLETYVASILVPPDQNSVCEQSFEEKCFLEQQRKLP